MNPTDRISKYLTYREATKSQNAERKGIQNIPNEVQIEAMKYVAVNVFDHVREFVGGPLHASSFFRSPDLNLAIGGSKTSQHMKGEAIDIDCDTFGHGTNLKVFNFIREHLPFDQLIAEYPDKEGNPSWVHVSLVKDPKKNRRQVLVCYNNDQGKQTFEDYNTWKKRQ